MFIKNYLSLILVLLVAVTLLGACSETAEPEEKVEPVEVQAEEPAEEVVAEEESEEEAKAKAAEEEAKAKAAEEAAAKLKAEEEEAAVAKAKAEEEAAAAEAIAAKLETQETYVSNMEGHITDFADHMETISILSTDAGNDPYLMLEQDWILDFAVALVSMDESIEAVRAENPPDSLYDSHQMTLKAMDEFEFVVDNMPKAVDNMDVDLIDASSAAITQGTEYLGEATVLLMESVE